MMQLRVGRAFQLGDDFLRQHLAQLDAPLIERIDSRADPWVNTLCSYERDQLAQRLGR